jgi:catechol 2,3-dioxygenase-like lactoylglutathione lyase family enzyme
MARFQVAVRFQADDRDLQADDFLALANRVWPGDYDLVRVQEALQRTMNIIRQTGEMMMIVGIDHVQLAMPPGREDEARAFYEGLLGLAELPKPAALAKRGGAWFENGAVKIHLGVEPDFRPARKAHPGLLVRDLRELIERLNSAGIKVVDDEPLAGVKRVYVDDPFGNRLELMERLK